MVEVNKNIDSENQIIKDDEIDLIEVTKTIWAGRKLILKVTGVFLIIGLIIAFGSKVEYEASCKLMPESQEGMKSNLGGLGSLAGLAGINLDMGGSGALTPDVYPQIAQSVPFILKVLNEPLHFRKKDTIATSYTYFIDIDQPSLVSFIYKYSIGLPSLIKTWITTKDEINQSGINIHENEIIQLDKEDYILINGFRKKITVEVDNKTGIIRIVTLMPDPVAAAEVNKLCMDLLTEYITSYKTEKAKTNLIFIEERFSESKIKFEASQRELAEFNDRNKNVVTSIAKTESQRLQNDFNVNFEVYKSLATKLEQAKIKVKEKTPIFTVLEPVQIPVYKSKPNRKLITAIFISLGVLVGIGLVGFKHLFSRIKNG